MFTAIVFVLVLGILVVVHELGHFWVARRNGVRVDEFGFGLPPRIFGIKKGEVLYSLNALPIGGFVKIFGEDLEEGKDDPRSFATKSVGARSRIIVAGVVMNVLLAVFLLTLGSIIGSPTAIDESNEKYASSVNVQMVSIAQKSPAEIAGFKVGDKILELMSGGSQAKIEDTKTMQEFMDKHRGENVSVSVLRGQDRIELDVVPRVNPPVGEGAIGVALLRVGIVKYPFYMAPIRGVIETYNIGYGFVVSVFAIFKSWIVDGEVIGEVAGPVGIFNLTGEVARLGFIYLLQFMAILSVNLAIINSIPFPALDGGRLLFLGLEKIKGSPVSIKWERYAHAIGLLILILLILLITYKDVKRMF